MKNYSYSLDLNLPPTSTKAQQELHHVVVKFLTQNKKDKLTVSRLCKTAKISGSTFYLYYSSVEELLEEVRNSWLQKLIDLDKELTNSQRKRGEDFEYFSKILDFIDRNLDFIEAFLINNYDIQLAEKWKIALKRQFWIRLGKGKVTPKQDFNFEIIASATLNSYIYYVKNHSVISRTDIYQEIAQVMNFLEN
ncbi:TetR/AcrR family transcriptional regulator [Lactobacillus sp. PV037]|uniref:TetR/AcrR family transcriptional regulator n=1 Tax=Lactobacillus sp. PV037 TaxID=2594496 RepID=UPI0022405057|nr:TetR/AcrR family transcriptional regulator [Lactobacillus sp. PV037]QNQ83681.1 TetR/AcrR family transcriptional regulator [Lactobacillus sp. PV037]